MSVMRAKNREAAAAPRADETPQSPSFTPLPLAGAAACLIAGIACGRFASPPLLITAAGGAVATASALWMLARRRCGVASIAVLTAFVCAGAALETIDRRGDSEDRVRRFYEDGRIAAGDPIEVTGVVKRAPELAPDGFYLTLNLSGITYRGKGNGARGTIELFAPVRDPDAGVGYEALELRRGARVRVMTALTRAETFRNPGGTALSDYLAHRGLDAIGAIKSPLVVERLNDELVFLPLVWLDWWRARLLERINKQFSAEAASLLAASMLGNRHGLKRATAERFREGGTFHVLVISGLHITFLGGLVWALARRLTRRRIWQWAAATACVWSYAVLVGAEVSVVRAAVMFTLVALAPVVHRRAGNFNTLGGAALLLVVWRPGDLFNPAFQLSVLAVLAIVALAWPLLTNLREIGVWRPTRDTPHPPVCAKLWRVAGETLFWSERRWRDETAHSAFSCRLFKTEWAGRLERCGLQRPLRYACAAALVSACVQAGMLPLLVVYFHRLSLASIVLNVVVGVLMALFSLGAVAAVAIAHASSTAAIPFVWLVEQTCWLVVHSIDPFAAAGVTQIRLPEYSGWGAVIYYLYYAPLVVLAAGAARAHAVARRETWTEAAAPPGAIRLPLGPAAAAFVILSAVIVFHPFSAGWSDGMLRVDFLDVGQGDAALVTMPDGTTLLIDGGGRPHFDHRPGENGNMDGGEGGAGERDRRPVGEAVVSEYLWWRGLGRVDYVLATHAHVDHMDGLNDVVSNFAVGAALVARAPAGDPVYGRFQETLRRAGVPVYLISQGDTIRLGAVTLDVLWPPPPRDGESAAAVSNDDSIALRLQFGRKALLFTGDIERRAEAALLAAAAATTTPEPEGETLRCDVIKVAHHGSKTSSSEEWVAATARPAVAVISVGLSSPYGHPDRGVVDRWSASGAEVLTTGSSGTITVRTDGALVNVETYVRDKPRDRDRAPER